MEKLGSKVTIETWRRIHDLLDAIGGLGVVADDLHVAAQAFHEHEQAVKDLTKVNSEVEAAQQQVVLARETLSALETKHAAKSARLWEEHLAMMDSRHDELMVAMGLEAAAVEDKITAAKATLEDYAQKTAAAEKSLAEVKAEVRRRNADLERTVKQISELKASL